MHTTLAGYAFYLPLYQRLKPNPTVESTHDELLNEGDQVPPREQHYDEIHGGREVIDIASAENAYGGY
jgi:hypothetical protein